MLLAGRSASGKSTIYMMQLAKRCDNIMLLMAEQERLASIVFRDNLLLLSKACALRYGKNRGSRKFMASIIPTSESHLSDLLNGKKGVTGKYKEQIETNFSLPANWLDESHPGIRPADLLRYIPSPVDVPEPRKDQVDPDDREAVVRRILELQKQIEQLASVVAPGRNTPK